jgi:hypothetical protein
MLVACLLNGHTVAIFLNPVILRREFLLRTEARLCV